MPGQINRKGKKSATSSKAKKREKDSFHGSEWPEGAIPANLIEGEGRKHRQRRGGTKNSDRTGETFFLTKA